MPNTVPIPTTSEEMTPSWLTNVLQSSGTLKETIVTSLSVETLGAAGAIGRMARLKPNYDKQMENLPTTLIAKYSHPDTDMRETFSKIYAKEVHFYRDLSGQLSLPIPSCYYSDVNPVTGDCIMLLEDLGHMRQTTFVDGCSLEDSETIVTLLAGLHGQWWENPKLETFAHLGRLTSTIDEHDVAEYQLFWSKFETNIKAVLPDIYLPKSFLNLGHQYGFKHTKIAQQIVDAPLTLIHHDVQPGNVMFATHKTDPPAVFIDWQGAVIGPGARDVGYFMIYSLPVEIRRQAENELLQKYCDNLLKQGVSNYSLEQCLRDYRLSFFRCMGILVDLVGRGHVDLSSPYFNEVLASIVSRTVSFAEEHNILQFLE